VMLVAEGDSEIGAGEVSVGNFADIREASSAYGALGAIYWESYNLADGDRPERVLGAHATAGYFQVFGAVPLHGRIFGAEEDRFGGPKVVVLSHRLWARQFGANPAVVGTTIRLNGVDHEVLGVMPASFDWTSGTEELWVPAAFSPEELAEHDNHFLTVYGRLAPGVSVAAARSELAAIMRQLAERFPEDNLGRPGVVRPMFELFVGNARDRLLVLLGAVSLVLLIACVNVANLLLARGAGRARELGVRAALGAGTARLVRQLLTETAALAALASLLGLGLAALTIRALVAAAPQDVPRLDQAAVNGPTLGFALGLGLLSTIVAGLLPAVRTARSPLVGALRDGVGGASPRELLKRGLVAAEVALAVVLLAFAGLLIRTALHQARIDPGFVPERVLSARVTLPRDTYPGDEQTVAAFVRLAELLVRAPGVEASGLSSQVPSGPGGNSNGLIPEGRPLELASTISTRLRLVTPGYLPALGVPLRAGRDFEATDVRGQPRVAIVSESFARTAWPDQSAIGKRFVCCEGSETDPAWKEVIGVAGDVRSQGVNRDAPLEFYLPIAQAPPGSWDWIQRSMTLVARGRDPRALADPVRAAVQELDPNVALYSVMTMSDRMASGLAPARFTTLLLAALGGLGLALAAIGIYGVIAFLVQRRTREIGIRMALGASRATVVRLVVRQTLAPVGVGVAIGVLGAATGSRALQSQLQGISAADPVTYLAVVVVLSAVALIAAAGPARRASRIDSTTALRAD
ncbi:MAG: ABC transporter permease, partial [Gemmatimonadales bacterium]